MHNLRTVRKLWIQFSLTRKQTQLQVFIAKHAFWDLTLGYYVGVVMWCHKYKIILPFCAFFYHLICGAVENQKGRKKIVVDFVNIGKHLFSLASYTHAYLSLSLCFSNFWLHLFLFCSLSLSDLLFWKTRKYFFISCKGKTLLEGCSCTICVWSASNTKVIAIV